MVKVSQEMVVEFVHLRRDGRSFREIGRQWDLDPRTVQLWVQRAEDGVARDHWEAVARLTDAEHLKEHRALITYAATSVSEAVQADSKLVASTWTPQELLYSKVELSRGRTGEILRKGGAEFTVLFTPDRDETPVEAPRIVRKLVGALMEHEPDLGDKVQRWKAGWAAFRRERSKLVGEARGLCENKKLIGGVVEPLCEAAAGEVIRSRFLGGAKASVQIEQEDGISVSLTQADGTKISVVCASPSVLGTGNGDAEVDPVLVVSVYDHLIEEMSKEARLVEIDNANARVVENREKIQDLVDGLLLRGRPNGSCSLCPGSHFEAFRA